MLFRDFNEEKEKWITFIDSDFYPNFLDETRLKYKPILKHFNELLEIAQNSSELFLSILGEKREMRIQLLRIFRRYISPDTSVEMLKIIKNSEKIISEFGNRFRPIEEVRKRFNPENDVLMGLLHEYEDRGQKGYDVSNTFFKWFSDQKWEDLTIEGPTGAGRDIILDSIFEGYPVTRPVDFVMRYMKKPIIIGFIRYDSDRGGAQEDDRISGYRNAVNEILEYSNKRNINLKILFVNDGPGLILGSMWNDYSALEDIDKDNIRVVTLKMLNIRVTREWILEHSLVSL